MQLTHDRIIKLISALHYGAVLSCALLIGISNGALAAPQNDKEASKYYEDASARFERNDFGGAIIQLKNALQQNPNMLAAHVLLGRTFLANGQAANAEQELEKSIRLGVDRAEVAIPLARAYGDQGKFKRLLENVSLERLPPSIKQELLSLRAYAQIELGDLRAARQSLDQARDAAVTKPASLILVEANLALREGKPDSAMSLADQAIKLEPNNAVYWNFRGTVSHSKGNAKNALADYGKALALNPKYLDARLARVSLMLDSAQEKEADLDIQYLLQEYPHDVRAAYLRAVFASKRNDSAVAREALQAVTKVTDAAPSEALNQWPQYLLLGGLAHYGLNQPEKAKTYLQRFLLLSPGHPGARKVLGSILLKEGDSNGAMAVLEQAVKTSPDDAYGLSLLASAYMAQKQYRKASELLERAVQVAAGAPQFESSLGFGLLGSGQEDLGLEHLTQAFRKDVGQSRVGMALAVLHIRRGQPQKAVAVAEAMVKREANNVAALNLLGVARVAAGNRSGGRAAYVQAFKVDKGFIPVRLNLAKLEQLEGKRDAARSLLATILKEQPNNTQALYEMARLEESLGRLDDAVRLLDKIHSLEPSNLGPALFLVDLHLRKNQASKALELAKDLENVSPKNLGVLAAVGRANVAMGRPGIAIVVYDGMTQLAGFDSAWQYRVARLQIDAGNQKAAFYNLEKSLQGNADFLPALTLLTQLELQTGKITEAERHAQQVVARYPAQAVGYGLQADIAIARGRFDEAIARYRTALEKEPVTGSAIRLYQVYAQAGRHPQANDFMAGWLKAHPADDVAMLALAEGHLRVGNLPAARSVYEAVLKRRKEDVGIFNNLANILIKQGDAGALDYAEKAYHLAPNDAAVGDTLGWVLVMQGQTEKGLGYLREAKLRDSVSPEIRYHLAEALSRLGRPAEARQELERALAGNPGFASIQDARKLQQRLSSSPNR
jgi:putative PEP-CTERM system TPR-repeat lipoprotein